MLDLAHESIKTLAPEIGPLMLSNWEERHMGAPKYRLQPNLDVYCDLEDRGRLYLYTARINRALVGYMVVAASVRLHAVEETIGVVDALYVLPAHRSGGTATALLQFAEGHLRREGVNTMLCGTNDPRIVRWLRMTCDYRYAETVLEKVL